MPLGQLGEMKITKDRIELTLENTHPIHCAHYCAKLNDRVVER